MWLLIASTLTVGTGKTYATIGAAASAAGDGDTIEIDAGTYREAVTWHAANLVVRGVGGRAIVDMTGMSIGNGKAIFVSAGNGATFENIEFVGASVTDANGAGIRWEGGGMLVVRGCVFRSNENGILGGGGAHPENVALIENSEFVDNGRGDVGYTHSVYINDADAVTFRGNWSHALWPGGADIGHLFKSRAHHTDVLYNRITAEDGPSSYEINIPQGGEARVIGNVIEQRMGGQRTMISFADGDGAQYAGSRLRVAHNTFVNDASGDATFIRTTLAGAQIVAIDNLFVGTGTMISGGQATMMGNLTVDVTAFVDPAAYDYHLVATSTAVDAAEDAGELVPTEQYVHPMATESRARIGGANDVGAFEFGNVPTGGDGAVNGGDDTAVGSNSGGCCGTSSGGNPLIGVVMIAFARRRRWL